MRLAILLAICAITGWAGPSAASDADNTARVIAGYSPAGTQREYAKEISAYWTQYESRIGRPMRAWGCRELGRAEGVTVFYPFSGPDLPTAYQFYPDADRYVLVAIEKAEAPPRLEGLSSDELASYLDAWRKAWKLYGALGFFRTDDLEAVESARGTGTGMTGPLMAFAVRLGFEIESVEAMQLAADANDVMPSTRNTRAAGYWDSVRLTLRKGGRRVIVDYVSLDLRDGWLVQLPGAQGWIDRMSGNPTLLKAASHLPQDPEFSIVRNSILWNAPIVVQDETGISYDALAKEFDVRLYGKFTKPNSSFRQDLQRDLAKAYQVAGPATKAVPFRFGYEKHAGSAMQVAIRKPDSQQERRNCK